MMKTHVLRGSKQEIAQNLARMSGEVREAIVFVEEPTSAASKEGTSEAEDIFTEMRPFMVDASDVEDSREAIYSRMDGE
jgi:hypothetical protein